MKESYSIKEALVHDYFKHKATIDEFAKSFAYMNCIQLKDYSNSEEYIDNIEPQYIIVNSDNDGMKRGDIVSWDSIEAYMSMILENGIADDIECLYCYLTDKY
jgi:hypothetical protein